MTHERVVEPMEMEASNAAVQPFVISIYCSRLFTPILYQTVVVS